MAISYHSAGLSLLSGLLACCAGLVAKLGLDQEQLPDTLLPHPALLPLLRLCLVCLTLCLNCCMLTVYTRALALSPTAAEASLLNTGANLCCSAVLGVAVCGEVVSAQWGAGAVLIVAGTFLVITDKDKAE